jgi:hypothetical protein
MAERLRKRHQDDIRTKIKVSNIIDRLEKHVAGEIEMTSAQVTSAKILLDKTMSNAPQIVAGPGDDGEHKLNTKIEVVIVDPKG